MSLILNKVILAGRLATTPEVKQTRGGTAVCDFRIAVSRKHAQGEHPESDFFSCMAWGNTAEFIGNYFHKGAAICVVGRIQTRSWEQDGAKRTATEIVVEEANFVESRNYKDPVTMPYEVAGQAATVPLPNPAPHFEEVKGDDDLPF